MASLHTINEYRPELSATVAHEIHVIAAWMDAHAEDLAADMGRMVVAEMPRLHIDIDINGLSSVSTSRKYYVPKNRAAPANADD
ncbi:hypothetical protein [Collinsella tanakaei]|uniref:hypothetical protein n=1 Tax=Collinsella tanakaei TaxID=626935 RepID=UPI0022E72F86|nr:hypothetical protein [Collinsella tanakaei]